VSKPEQKEVVNWHEFTGRTAAVKLVTVAARVSGYIVDIPFKEGDIVHKGDLLFQIDPDPISMLTTRRLASCSRRKPISSCRM
jgi:membrane fusion protein, multidrug efflux system